MKKNKTPRWNGRPELWMHVPSGELSLYLTRENSPDSGVYLHHLNEGMKWRPVTLPRDAYTKCFDVEFVGKL